MKQRVITILNALAVFAALVVLWQLILWVFRVPPFMLPPPWAVVRAVGARFPSLLNSLAITGELLAGSSRVGEGGLGYSILYASSQLQTDYLFALVLAATVLGFSFLFLVMFLEWYFLHRWHESARTPETE